MKIWLVMIYDEFNKNIPPFPLMYIGDALQKAGFEVKLSHISTQEIEEEVETIVVEKPLFVGFSVITGAATFYSAMMSKKIKEKCDVTIVWGGVHPSLLPESPLIRP